MVKCVMLNINARLHMLVPHLKELFNLQLLLCFVQFCHGYKMYGVDNMKVEMHFIH